MVQYAATIYDHKDRVYPRMEVSEVPDDERTQEYKGALAGWAEQVCTASPVHLRQVICNDVRLSVGIFTRLRESREPDRFFPLKPRDFCVISGQHTGKADRTVPWPVQDRRGQWFIPTNAKGEHGCEAVDTYELPNRSGRAFLEAFERGIIGADRHGPAAENASRVRQRLIAALRSSYNAQEPELETGQRTSEADAHPVNAQAPSVNARKISYKWPLAVVMVALLVTAVVGAGAYIGVTRLKP